MVLKIFLKKCNWDIPKKKKVGEIFTPILLKFDGEFGEYGENRMNDGER